VSLVLLMDVIEHIEDDAGFLTGLLDRPDVGLHAKFLITALRGSRCDTKGTELQENPPVATRARARPAAITPAMMHS
jgi:hypothetical protein